MKSFFFVEVVEVERSSSFGIIMVEKLAIKFHGKTLPFFNSFCSFLSPFLLAENQDIGYCFRSQKVGFSSRASQEEEKADKSNPIIINSPLNGSPVDANRMPLAAKGEALKCEFLPLVDAREDVHARERSGKGEADERREEHDADADEDEGDASRRAAASRARRIVIFSVFGLVIYFSLEVEKKSIRKIY